MIPPSTANEKLKVELGPDRSYEIIIGSNNLDQFGAHLKSLQLGNSVFIVTTPVINRLYGKQLLNSLTVAGFNSQDILLVQVPDGEQSKSVEQWLQLIDKLYQFDRQLHRQVLLINFGGGVVGDLGGYVAASYRRGINYVQLPTTLLSHVDSAVGGKVGIDFSRAKNLIGSFYQPQLVWADIALLKTLDERQIRSGLAEVIKYGVISDPELFVFVEEHYRDILSLDIKALHHVVKTSYAIKLQLVEADELDQKGVRVKLNFGHTVGHAIEAAAGYALYTHGEAVAAGMLCAAEIARQLGIFPQAELSRLESLLLKTGLPVKVEGVELEQIMDSLLHDKKFVRGKNRFVLPTGIGQVQTREAIPDELIRRVIAGRLLLMDECR
jgi:3-dehydroquinate synthase